MRQLNEDETELTIKGIARLQDEAEEMQGNLDYNKAIKDKEKFLRAFDDRWRDYLRFRKDEEDDKLLKQMKEMINQKKYTIKEMEKQLKEGVETPSSVK